MEEVSSRALSSSSAAVNEEDKVDDLNYEYDDFNGNGQQLNIPNEGKPAVYPQQQALAHHILKRIKLSQKIQKLDFERFDSLDIQVSLFITSFGLWYNKFHIPPNVFSSFTQPIGSFWRAKQPIGF